MKAADPANVIQLRRTYRGEDAWFPLLEEVGHRALRLGLIADGETPTMAGQLVWFVDEQTTLDRHLTDVSRVRYRRRLEGHDLATVSRLASRAIPGQRDSVPVAA